MSLSAHRKIVTVLFCDVVGSTALGESMDPEALQGLLARYFERMKGIVESHGGSVEKFIGDAVMAVFGVPVVHEDDALRACRAAVEMREALPELGLEGRIGVNTGEVLAGTEERLATGDAVNVAARLEQAAQPGEVLIGAPTLALVRDAAEVEPVEPLELKGKAEPVPAYRLLGVRDAQERRHGALFVGRERELAILREAWERVQTGERCELVTIIGDAGIGKSRLAAEFLISVEATVVRGRCLPYGEGITYWPVVEVLKQLDLLPPEEAATAAIRSLLGESEAATSAEEIAWAFRKTLEQAAAERPLVVVFDDIQWGEETFRDLIEHVALLSSGAGFLLLCMARPELAEHSAAWPVTLRLEPLATNDVEKLIAERITGDLRERIAHAAGGNPLFIEGMLAMADEAEGDVVVPPTLQALLAARLDQLDPAERSVLERGAVEGEIFHRGAVQALAPAETQVTPRLAALVRKELIRPDKAHLAGEDGFRFRHLLIRDAAYESLPKATRAQLHEQFANWLDGQKLIERDEILGYHLEQAHRYRRELDPEAAELPGLAGRAAEHLAAAGRAALDRGDARAARTLLERATAVLPQNDERRLAHVPELADAYHETADKRAFEILTEARSAGNPITRARAAVRLGTFGLERPSEIAKAQRVALLEEARAVFEAESHDLGLAEYWQAEAQERWAAARAAETAEACEHALLHLERAGAAQSHIGQRTRQLLLRTYIFSPIPVDDALARVSELSRDDDGPLVRAEERIVIGSLLSMKGQIDRARELVRGARQMFAEAGLLVSAWRGTFEADIAIRAGDWPKAERTIREGFDRLEELGEHSYSSTIAAVLPMVLVSQRKLAAAREALDQARRTAAADDLLNFVFIELAEGRLLAHENRLAEAEAVGRRAVELADRIDFCFARPLAHSYFAETLALARKPEEATHHATTALGILEAKGDVMLAARVRERLAAAGVPTSETA